MGVVLGLLVCGLSAQAADTVIRAFHIPGTPLSISYTTTTSGAKPTNLKVSYSAELKLKNIEQPEFGKFKLQFEVEGGGFRFCEVDFNNLNVVGETTGPKVKLVDLKLDTRLEDISFVPAKGTIRDLDTDAEQVLYCKS